MVLKRCFPIFVPRKRSLFIFVIFIYIFYFTWFEQASPINFVFLTSALNLNCNNRDTVCKKCPTFNEKINHLQTCFEKILLNTKYEEAKAEKGLYLPTKALKIISNISDFCNEEFFLQQDDILQLLTLNGPKIGEGFGTLLFLKSEVPKLGCRVGIVGSDENKILEKQLKPEIAECEIMALNENLNNGTKMDVENLNGSFSDLINPESEEVSNYEKLANVIERFFRKYPLDNLFIKYWFSLANFLEFLEEIEISENPICQINARIKISENSSFEAASKQFSNLFDSDFYPFHIDVRGNELQIFFINSKRLYCVEKFFSTFCSKFGFIF